MTPGLSPIVPLLHYADVDEAAEWLTRVFGLRLNRISRAPDDTPITAVLQLGNGMIFAQHRPEASALTGGRLYIYVGDVDAHCEHVRSCSVATTDPQDQPWGDRVYDTHDLQGHPWTFASPIIRRRTRGS